MDCATVANTIGEIIQRWAKIQPDAPALIAEGSSPLSYRQLATTIDGFRDRLNAAGFGRHDRIAIVNPGGAEMATALLGVMSGATAVPLKPDLTAAEFSAQLTGRGARAVIVPSGTDTPVHEVASALGLPAFELARPENASTGAVALRPGTEGIAQTPGAAEPLDLSLVMLTSGTTSGGKIVPHRQCRTVCNATTMATLYGLTPADRSLIMRPLHYSGAIHNAFATLISGGSLAFLPEFGTDSFFRSLVTLQPTWFAGSPAFFHAILAGASAHADSIARHRLRFISANSARLDTRIAERMEQCFDVFVQVSYSSTETGKIAGNPQPPGRSKPGTVGLLCGPEMKIMAADGSFLPPGRRGEVVVRGEQVFEGYEADPAANDAAFVNGWFRTGDEGYFDEDGYLVLTGRLKEMINRGGEKVSPDEVDSALLEHPDIADAACFPLPHATLGEIVAAAVVPTAGAAIDPTAIKRFLAERLARFKIPAAFVFVDEIPREPSGKTRRSTLSALYPASR